MANLPKLDELLFGNTYPGRGIAIGENPSRETIIIYFIMGRSENSRNRVFERTEDGIRTRAFDESKCTDIIVIQILKNLIHISLKTINQILIKNLCQKKKWIIYAIHY